MGLNPIADAARSAADSYTTVDDHAEDLACAFGRRGEFVDVTSKEFLQFLVRVVEAHVRSDVGEAGVGNGGVAEVSHLTDLNAFDFSDLLPELRKRLADAE